jgi:hypothetical protein
VSLPEGARHFATPSAGNVKPDRERQWSNQRFNPLCRIRNRPRPRFWSGCDKIGRIGLPSVPQRYNEQPISKLRKPDGHDKTLSRGCVRAVRKRVYALIVRHLSNETTGLPDARNVSKEDGLEVVDMRLVLLPHWTSISLLRRTLAQPSD